MMMVEKKVFLLLTDTGTMLTKLIKFYTRKPYNHASISFNSELTEVYSFGRKTPRNPFIGGFVKEDIKSIIFQKASCAIYSLTLAEEDVERMKRYIKEIEEQKEQYRYNFLGLFGVALQRPVKRKKAFFCSQFVASVLYEANTFDYNKELALIEPSELPKISNFQLEYEGRLHDYYDNRSIEDRKFAPYPFYSVEM